MATYSTRMTQPLRSSRNSYAQRASKTLRWPKAVPGVSPARVVLARTHTNSYRVVPVLSPRMIAARPLLLVRLTCECALMCLPRRASCVTLWAQRHQVLIIVSATKVLRHNVIHLDCHASASIFLRLACVVITRENARTYACPLVSRVVERATDVLGPVAIALRPAWSVSCYTHSIIPICEYPVLHLMFRPRKAMPVGWGSIALRGRRTTAWCSTRLKLFSCQSSGRVRICTACESRIPTPNRNVARNATLSESK